MENKKEAVSKERVSFLLANAEEFLKEIKELKIKMIKNIMKDPLFLAQKSTDATKADQQVVVDLLDTLRANLNHPGLIPAPLLPAATM